MRTFQRAGAARRQLTAGLLAAAIIPWSGTPLLSAPDLQKAETAPIVPLPTRSPMVMHSFQELRARLDKGDKITALHALQLALNQVGDGAVFTWTKNSKGLKGIIKPTAAFRNADGQICRHVIYALALGPYRKQIEFIACREAAGRWRL
ncbi:MAG: hypothetical protein D6773_06670 [Alphaproteobacteria bacterium]|nr:MAG: hypothetical protein D6773_06670 [Alphaproteobacteria bacterium]